MARKPQKSSLLTALDDFALTLIEEAKASKVATETGEGGDGRTTEGIEFGQRVQAFTALTRYLQVKHRIDPDENSDAWGKEFDKFHGRASGGKGRPRKGDTDTAGSDDDGGSPIPLNAFRPRQGG
jgi:hypothetical protein